LKDTPVRPAKMRALHSSSALVVNVFDYWRAPGATRLGTALGLNSDVQSIQFEAQFPTGLDGNPPNLDLALVLKDGITVGIESKFTEWLHAKSPERAAFKPRYFPPATGLWDSRALHQSQLLAHAMSEGATTYRHLDAAQLLKHALGLATQVGSKFTLLYVYFDWPCVEADLHRSEIQQFSSLVGSELRFRPLTYQEVYGRLKALSDPADSGYIGYLRDRYFH
jgi:restriction endonuclease-like protein